MTSRLERLFLLLEAGAGAATRQAAARQLGEVQRAHPEELHRLLARLMVHLRSPAWETRTAAAEAVGAILANVPEWNPPPYDETKEENNDEDLEERGRLTCEEFDIDRVLVHGAQLMASEGHEFDLDEDALQTGDINERLAKQRQLLNSKLGLDVACNLGIDIGEMYTNEDLCPSPAIKPQNSRPDWKLPTKAMCEVLGEKPLSSREMNVAKRKARQAFTKQRSRDSAADDLATHNAPDVPDEADCKRIKLEPNDQYLSSCTGAVPERSGAWGPGSRWPLHQWSGALQAQLFSAAWEARHGAAGALRELLKARVSSGAGRTPQHPGQEAHQRWLEDMSLRLVCVLALDRFGDFVSDQVVAPVRETAAQALGVAAARLRAERVRQVAGQLARLAGHKRWEARHGALLGFKYLVAARPEVSASCGALERLVGALEDGAEDVAAVAAGALVPAAGALAAACGPSLRDVVARLWRLLAERDDLAAPANCYMALLAALMALPDAAALLRPIDLEDVLPRLWPYLQHSTSSVRKATLQTMRTITRPLVPQTDSEDMEGSEQHLSWTWELLQATMRHVYQRILFEHQPDIQDIALQVWENLVRYAQLGPMLLAACPMLATWLCLAMQPARLPAEPLLLLLPPTKERRARGGYGAAGVCGGVAGEGGGPEGEGGAAGAEARAALKWYVGGSESQRDRNVTRTRCYAAHALGYLSCYLVHPAPGVEYKAEDDSPVLCYVKVLVAYLSSGSALQRLVASLVISSWAERTAKDDLYPPQLSSGAQLNGGHHPVPDAEVKDNKSNGYTDKIAQLAPPLLTNTLHSVLNQTLYYDEVALSCNKTLQEARDLVAMMRHYKLPVDGEEFTNILRLEQVSHMTQCTQPLVAALKCKRVATTLEQRRAALHDAVTHCARDQAALSVAVQAAAAGACAHLRAPPPTLNPVVRPLMESVKREPEEHLQLRAARALAALLALLADRQPCPNGKVLLNLKHFLRCDPEYTPRIALTDNTEEIFNAESGSGDSGAEDNNVTATNGPALDKYNGILTLWEQQRAAERVAPRRGRPPAHQPHQQDLPLEQSAPQEDEACKLLRIQRRGATLALTTLTAHFGEELPEKLPILWEYITEPFSKVMTDEELESQDTEGAEELVSRLQVVETVCGSVHDALWPRLLHDVGALAALARHRLTAVRHMSARCLAAMATRSPPALMLALTRRVLPALTDAGAARVRCGAAETLARVVDALQLLVVPYVALLVVPLLGRMSDPCAAVRVMSTRCFASLIQLMPLDGAAQSPPGLGPELSQRRARDKRFLDRLFHPKAIEDYTVPLPVAAELRSYQQAGVNWLRFLNEYGLHGVLCDDMGLGKTLQSIVVVAGDHLERARAGQAPLRSLVVCPPTLTGHWVCEVNKFIPNKYLKPLQYVGPPVERERLRGHVMNYNLIVASYDIVRKDIDFFSSIKWNYCILDEGHVIKNGKTKAFKAIKRLVANHRLILSGTPIQNNVLELWSLFDFLMPGLLGTERQFTARYSRPILLAREQKATPHHLQAGARAVEALHRQVLPFLLRRVKEDVLKELPPKITQDYYCELSPLQRRLYEDCSRTQRPHQHTHVFQALHYLQNVCNHPKLVLTAEHPARARVLQDLAAQRSTLDEIHHAAKLPALKQLLLECGIGAEAGPLSAGVGGVGGEGGVVSQHRALVFCQLKAMLDIVERDLLQRHLPRVSYLRLDGAVPPAHRHHIVTRFNGDPSIDLLLLTTTVGGLGLNLTGADTVIFVEHDWNPMKDLQAMDRAHRIGQKKVVNVYRLITRDTLEEKIMGLQKFKLVTANTVISKENAAIETMGTEQLLDLFQLSSSSDSCGTSQQSLPAGTNSVLETLPDLWDDKQYEEEYDMTSFIKSLNKMNS